MMKVLASASITIALETPRRSTSTREIAFHLVNSTRRRITKYALGINNVEHSARVIQPKFHQQTTSKQHQAIAFLCLALSAHTAPAIAIIAPANKMVFGPPSQFSSGIIARQAPRHRLDLLRTAGECVLIHAQTSTEKTRKTGYKKWNGRGQIDRRKTQKVFQSISAMRPACATPRQEQSA